MAKQGRDAWEEHGSREECMHAHSKLVTRAVPSARGDEFSAAPARFAPSPAAPGVLIQHAELAVDYWHGVQHGHQAGRGLKCNLRAPCANVALPPGLLLLQLLRRRRRLLLLLLLHAALCLHACCTWPCRLRVLLVSCSTVALGGRRGLRSAVVACLVSAAALPVGR